MLQSWLPKKKFNLLVTLISGEGIFKLLGVLKISSGTGESQGNAFYESIKDCGLLN